jgi:predicted MFS family arabinose efflux permease
VIATLRTRNFSLLWLAGLVSQMGNWMLFVALPFHVYAVTGSALATSAWLMAYILPGVLFGSVAGVFVDRWDRRKTMIAVNLLQALIIPLLLLVQSPQYIWIVYVVGFIEASLGQFFSPAESALLPTLVGEEHLVSANSLNALNDNLARIFGSAVGGLLLGAWGLSAVVIADAVSYLLAALLIAFIAAPPAARVVSETAASARASFAAFWHEWIAGLRLIVHDRILTNIFAVLGVALFADAILSAVLVVFIQDTAGLNATEFGWILTARGIGGLAGGLLIAQFGQKVSNQRLASWGLLWTGLMILVAVLFPSLLIIAVSICLAGVSAIAWMVAFQTMLQQNVIDEYRGRVFGAYGTTVSLLMLVSSGFAGASADWLGATALIIAAAVITLFAGILAWVLIKPDPAQDSAAVSV